MKILTIGLLASWLTLSATPLPAAESSGCRSDLPLQTTEQVTKAVQCQLNGRILRVGVGNGPPDRFEVLVLADGRISTYWVDAETGIVQPSTSTGD